MNNTSLPLLVLQTDLHDTTYSDSRILEVNSHMNNTNHSTLPPLLFIPCDNPQNLISPFVRDVVELLVYVGIFPVLVTCGVITNIINMAVFARQGLSDRIHVCLFSLAMSDTGYLVFVMCSKSYALLSLVDPAVGNYWQQRHYSTVQGVYLACLSISNTITAVIAVERCLCVLSPLKAAKVFRTKYLRVLIIVVSAYILVIKNAALIIKYQTVEITDPLTNTSTFISRLSPLYLRHRTVIDIIYLHLISVAIPFLSLTIVIVCTTAIILRLKVTAKWRKSVSHMTSVEKQEASVTRMLVTVCCVYIACMTPSVARVLSGSLSGSLLPGFLSSGYLCNTYKVATAYALLLEAVNASVNFLVYFKHSSQYRSTLSQIGFWGKPQEAKREGFCSTQNSQSREKDLQKMQNSETQLRN